MGATTCYGLGFAYTRRFFRAHSCDATTVAASQIGAGALVIAALTPVIGRDPVDLSPAVVVSIILLGAVGTGVADVWYTNVINAWGATLASTVTYLTPITGVILGMLVLQEQIRWNEIVGGNHRDPGASGQPGQDQDASLDAPGRPPLEHLLWTSHAVRTPSRIFPGDGAVGCPELYIWRISG
ncbi:EamA family transporter [Kocuria kalidii]|uniref:DMT family transporter n=1 Tax=Kocuria kalidii TaxID=3376283 RepID=UPI0037A859DA